jgi:hypothetical protein
MADLLYTIGADASNFNTNVKGLAATAQDASAGVTGALDQAGQSVNNLGNQAQSASMRFITMRSGLSALRDGTLAFAVGGQRADMMFMAMGHHITSLVNETGSLKGAFASMAGSLIGPGGVILGLTIAYEIFEKFGKKEKEAYDATKAFDSAMQAHDSVIQNMGDEYKTAVSNVSELTENVKLAKEGFISKSEVVKEYNDTLGKTMGAVTSLDEVEKKLVSGAPDYIKMMLLKAAAQSALKEASDKALEAAKIQMEDQANFKPNAFTQFAIGGGTMAPGAVPSMGQPLTESEKEAKIAQIAEENRAKKKALMIKDQNDLLKIFNDFQDQAAKIAGDHKWSFVNPGGDTKQDNTAYQRLIKQAADLKLKLSDAILANDKPTVIDALNVKLVETEQKITDIKAKIETISTMGGRLGIEEINASSPMQSDKKGHLGLPGQDEKIQFGTKEDIQGMTEWNKKVIENIALMQKSRVLTAEYKKDLKEEDSELRKLSHTIGEGLGRALESALNGTQNFFNAMGQFLTKLVEQLIAAIAEALILATILSIFSGGTISVMGELSNVSSFGGMASMGAGLIPHHASGGIFTTPHMGVFGEAGPEAIVTPKHLQEFAGINGGNGSVKMEPFLIGSDMWFKQTNRTNKTIGRTS